MLRLHYVPGGHGSPVGSKRSVPWNFGHIFLCCQDLSRLVKSSYVVLRYPQQTVVLISRCVTEALRYFTVITIIITFYYGLLRSITACFFPISAMFPQEMAVYHFPSFK